MYRFLATVILSLQVVQSLSFSIPISSPLPRHVYTAVNNDHVAKKTTTTAVSSSSSSSSSDDGGASDNTLVLYGHPGTRSPLINWACYELGLTDDKDLKMGDLSQNPHPFGQIPCLTDSDGAVVVFESGAILAYLLEHYSPSTLSSAARASILSWITWANASLDPICFLETPDGKVYDTGLKRDNKRINQLERILTEQDGVLVPDAGFSIADVAVSSYLLYVVQFFPQVQLAQKWPRMVQYMVDAASRYAYQQAFGNNVQSALVSNLKAQQKVAADTIAGYSDSSTRRSGSSDDKKLFGLF